MGNVWKFGKQFPKVLLYLLKGQTKCRWKGLWQEIPPKTSPLGSKVFRNMLLYFSSVMGELFGKQTTWSEILPHRRAFPEKLKFLPRREEAFEKTIFSGLTIKRNKYVYVARSMFPFTADWNLLEIKRLEFDNAITVKCLIVIRL